MADIYLTEKDDTYDHTKGKEWTTIRGLGGNDVVFIHGNGKVLGGPGNDVITNDVFDYVSGGVVYRDSPSAIYVDLEAGYALDGYGTRDTLVNIRDVDTSGQNGDVVLGTSKSDNVWLNGFNWKSRQPGSATLDLRGGSDTVNFWNSKPSDIKVEVSADGRVINLLGINGYSAILKNVETLLFREVLTDGKDFDYRFNVIDLIDLQTVGSSTLLRGYKGWQSNGIGSPTTITYSFLKQAPSSGGEGGAGFTAFSVAQQQTVRDLFYVLQNQTGLAFAEVAGDAGQIRLGVNQQSNTRGYSYIPDEFKGDARAGDVWIDQETAAVMTPGQEGYYVLLHELAHALGLQHPLTEADTSGATVLLNTFSSINNTVMLDVSAASVGSSWPTWFGSFDLQALRYLYGTRAYASGNDTYTVKDATSNMTIIDDGGMDTLDASTVSVSVSIDLRGGKSSSIGMDTDGTSKFNNVAIAAGSLIENVMGSPYDDVIIGNAQNNLVTFMGGNDIVDGQGGVDTIRLWSKSTEFKVAKDTSTGYWNVEAVNNISGSMELQNTERLIYTDTAWALDTGDAQSAGRTAKILGAVFGKEGLANMTYRGIGLFYFDYGMSYEALTLLALDARVGPGASKETVAQLLQANVPGLVVNAGAYATTTAMAMYAQESALNKTMVDVVGLATAGMPYLFWG
jgi:serralysin